MLIKNDNRIYATPAVEGLSVVIFFISFVRNIISFVRNNISYNYQPSKHEILAQCWFKGTGPG